MRKRNVRVLCGVICAAAVAATGCGGGTPSAQTETAQEEQAPADPADSAKAGEAAQETADGQEGLYESPDGWTAQYESSVIALTEAPADKRVTFTYTGESGGENYVEITYYPGMQDQEALYEVMAEPGGLPEHERSEGYFAGRTDIWSLRAMVNTTGPDGADEYKDYIAVEHNDGALVLEVVRQAEMDEPAEQKIDDTFSDILDSFAFTNHAPQTGDEYVWGTYTAEDGTSVLLSEDHTGMIRLQDDIPIIWYRREGKVLDADTYEQIYEYAVEGDALYLMSGDQTLEFRK